MEQVVYFPPGAGAEVRRFGPGAVLKDVGRRVEEAAAAILRIQTNQNKSKKYKKDKPKIEP